MRSKAELVQILLENQASRVPVIALPMQDSEDNISNTHYVAPIWVDGNDDLVVITGDLTVYGIERPIFACSLSDLFAEVRELDINSHCTHQADIFTFDENRIDVREL